MLTPVVEDVLWMLSMNLRRFLYGLDRTPEDRLMWAPAEGGKTPLQLADKTAVFAKMIAGLLATKQWPERGSIAPAGSTSREAAKSGLTEAFGELSLALQALAPEDMDAIIPAPWGPSPLRYLVLSLNGVLMYHQGQLNYVQLCYGDTDANIPPDWSA